VIVSGANTIIIDKIRALKNVTIGHNNDKKLNLYMHLKGKIF
jgi:hypothetical protein